MARGSIALPSGVAPAPAAANIPIPGDVGSVTTPSVTSEGTPSLVEMLMRGRGMIADTTMPGGERVPNVTRQSLPLPPGVGQTPGQTFAGGLPARQPSRLELALSGQMGRTMAAGAPRGPQIMGPPRLPSFYGRPSAPSMGRSMVGAPPVVAPTGGRAMAPPVGQMTPDLLSAIMASRPGGGRGGSVM